MARAFEQLAVDALYDYLETNLEAKLTAIDSSITAPARYLKAFAPALHEFPSVQVYDITSEPHEEEGNRNAIATVDVGVAVVNVCNADVASYETMEDHMRKYVQAVRDCVADDPTLDSSVIACIWTEHGRDFPIDFESETTQTRALGFTILVSDP